MVKLMTDRIKRLVKEVRNVAPPICVKKFEIASNVLKENRNATPYMQRVAVLEAYFDQMPIFILDDHLLVGDGASKPYGIEVCYENGMWVKEELEEMHKEFSWCALDDETYQFCIDYLNDPDRSVSRGLPSRLAEYVFADERLGPVQLSSLGWWKSREAGIKANVSAISSMGLTRNAGLAIPLYQRMLSIGARGIINICKERIANASYSDFNSIEKIDFWNGVIRVFEAWIRRSNRYADLAERMAGETEDSVRAAELLEIARICRKVPEHPAETFREAMQSYWFTWATVGTSTNSAGRFDQYMYPYYKKDLEEGRITYDEALELLENMKVKCHAFRNVSGNFSRGGISGGAAWYNYTIGGVDKDGNDATNDLTYMLIEASRETMLPNHTLTLRVHDGTPPELMQKAVELVKTGLGMPAFISDNEYINFFVEHGVSLERARDFSCAGCLDGSLPGTTRIAHIRMFGNTPQLDIFLHNGVCSYSGQKAGIETGDPRDFKTFEEFMEAFYKQQHYLVKCMTDICNINMRVRSEYNQDPFFSALMEGCLEEGEEVTRHGYKPYDNLIALGVVGAINLCDSFTAIKYWIYDKKKYTMDQLITALDANWEGYEDMRQDFIAAPKYGSNDDYADSIVAEYYERFAKEVESCKHPFGNIITAGVSVSTHQVVGRMTPATPDGRKAGEILADGSTSPSQGCDKKGILGVFASAMKIDQSLYNATLLNQKFHPSALKSPEDVQKLASAIRTYLLNGGKHVQFTIADTKMLRDAQVNPENHRDLTVRVAGYSAYFTTLTNLIQNEVINRSEHSSI